MGLNEQVLKLLEEKNVLRLNLEFSLKETDFMKEKLRKAEEKIESLSIFLNCYFYILNNPINLQTIRSNIILLYLALHNITLHYKGLKNEGFVSEQIFEFFPRKQAQINKEETLLTSQPQNMLNYFLFKFGLKNIVLMN